MKRYLAYLSYLIIHKIFVFYGCIIYKVPLHLAIIHDWDKLLPHIWYAFANKYYDENGNKINDNIGFNPEWNDHQKRNKHHWHYWVCLNENCEPFYKALEMPDVYIREMLADWYGAGYAKTGENRVLDWYHKNKDKMILHPETRIKVEAYLNYYTPN